MRNVKGNEVLTGGVANRDQLTIVDCYADWCAPCRQLKPVLEHAMEKYGDIEVVCLNIDDEAEFAAANGVRSIPTLLWYRNGQLIHRSVGMMKPSTLNEKIEELK